MQTKKDSSGRTPSDIVWNAPKWLSRILQSKAVARTTKFGIPIASALVLAFLAGLTYSRIDNSQGKLAAARDLQPGVGRNSPEISHQSSTTTIAAPGSQDSSSKVSSTQTLSGGNNVQQSAGNNSTQDVRHVEKPVIYIEAPKARVMKREEELKASLQNWSEQVSDLRRLMNQRADANARLSNANGVVAGLESFLATAKSVQTRFDEGEANRGASAWWNGSVAAIRAAAAKSAVDARADIDRLSSEIRDCEARGVKIAAEIESELAELGDINAGVLEEIGKEFAAAKAAATEIPRLLAKIEDFLRTEANHLGVIRGATEHQQSFFDIMFGMDREEAVWSRNGGERRAPAGGYTRLVEEGIVNPSRAHANGAKGEAQKLQEQLMGSAETFTTSIATMRGLARGLLAGK